MSKKLNIGISCFPTWGGSGVIATEIGLQMAKRGHRVHFISSALPRRFNRFTENVFFHSVEASEYPVFTHPHYDLALASKMVEVCTYEKLDIMHVHYAIPHAASAYLAKKILGDAAPKIITTLHGTDITLVGNERSYLPVARFSIVESDGVTAPSMFLRHATYDKLNVPSTMPIEVIENFVDTERFIPIEESKRCRLRECLELKNKPILVHISNFRPVKRIEDVVKTFALVKEKVDCHLVLVGDGPTRSEIESLIDQMGLKKSVCLLGKQEEIEEILQSSSIFLLPSKNESFGLAALEAMSCGLPVVASNAEGIPEVVIDGSVGYLSDVGDVEEMSKNCIRLLEDKKLYAQFSANARKLAVEKYGVQSTVDRYEKYYFDILEAGFLGAHI